MVVLATICLVIMAISAWEAAIRARNIVIILQERLRPQNLPEIQPHEG